MSIQTSKIVPCLWFDTQGEQAAQLYTRVFPNSRIVQVTRFPDVGQEVHGKPADSVMTVEFELEGQPFTALNGGPLFKFSEAVSLQVMCETQEEIDHYWSQLSEGGDPAAQQCGWLKDRYGLSWQITPRVLLEWVTDPDAARAKRVFAVMMEQKKLDIAALRKAAG